MKTKLKLVDSNPFTEDAVLYPIADWHTARAKAVLSWAESNKADCFGANEEGDIGPGPEEAVREMGRSAQWLAKLEPRTMRGARELLTVVVMMLSDRQIKPNSVLGEGPVIEMVRNVREALDYANADTLIGPRAK